MPVKVENYSASGILMRTYYYYVDYMALQKGKYIFTKFQAVNHIENNQRTLIKYENIKYDAIENYTLTKAFLEQKPK